MNAADFLVGAGGSQLGLLEAGLVGSWTTPVISALSGGLLMVFVSWRSALPCPASAGTTRPASAPEQSAVAAAVP